MEKDFKTSNEKPQKAFQNVVGVIFSCLGCVIGTGNIWRFPRIVARNSGQEGAACFFIIWFICLFTWSIPLLVIEYAIGRYTRVSPIRCFVHFMGKIGIFLGGWITFVNFFIGAYYMVILGWCLYYVYLPMKMSLPSEEKDSQEIFDSFVKSSWSFIPFTLCHIIIAASVLGGIKIIEKVNVVLVPILLAILLGIFFYSTTLPYSEYGFNFLFTGDWNTLTMPSLYMDAISQNAFDTAAASGLITAYSMYLTKSNSIMRYSLFIPIFNNLVSFLASMTIFPTVFGLMMSKYQTITQTGILTIIKGGGLAGTGLTFIWIPILLETISGFGRPLCSIFFICLSFAGISSLISNIELQTITLMTFGIKRWMSVLIISSSMYLFGIISVLELKFLVNQDYVWGFSLIVSGLIYIALVIKYGPFNFRSNIVNKQKFKNDFNLPYFWIFIIIILAPIQAVAILVWWIYSEIKDNPNNWFDPGWSTIITTWIEWIIFALILAVVSWIIIKLDFDWVKKTPISSSQNEPEDKDIISDSLSNKQSNHNACFELNNDDSTSKPSLTNEIQFYDGYPERTSTFQNENSTVF